MTKAVIPGAGETVEFLSETIRQRILERIDEIGTEKSKLTVKAVGQTKAVRKVDQPLLYRSIRRLEKQLKSLNRGLGGLLTSDPEAIVNPKNNQTWVGLLHDLVDKDVTGPDLAKKLETFGSFVNQSRNVVPGKVGHHRTALSVLREVLKDKPFEYRKKFKEIVQSAGYKIGEEYVDFIDPAAHKEFTKKVAGSLSKRLGYTDVKEVPETLLNALSDRYAHAMQFGSNKGFNVPANFLKADVDPEKLFAFSQPYLEAAQRGADSAQELETILTKGQWESADELTDIINKVKVRDTSDLLDYTGKPLMNRMSESKVISNLAEGITEADINPKALKASDALSIGKFGKKMARLSPVPLVTTGLSAMSAVASENKQQEDPNALNWTEMQADRVSLAGSSLSTASLPLLATPLTAPIGVAGIGIGETIDAFGTGVSIGTDVVRGALNPAKIRGRSGAKRAMEDEKDKHGETQLDLAARGF